MDGSGNLRKQLATIAERRSSLIQSMQGMKDRRDKSFIKAARRELRDLDVERSRILQKVGRNLSSGERG